MGLNPKDFYGPAVTMSQGAIVAAAQGLSVEPEVLQAIVQQETHDQGFLSDGRPVILYEPYVFHKLTDGHFDDTHPDLSVDAQSKSDYGPGGDNQYQKLARAMVLNEEAALQSCSWGFWQCMGFNFKYCGYDSVTAMVQDFVKSEVLQLQAFATFLRERGFIPAMQAKDWAAIASKYNGPNYKVNNYDTQLKKYYDEATSSNVRLGSVGPQVTAVQQLLVQAGYSVTVDGTFGSSTESAVRDVQTKKGLVVDGVVSTQTLSAIALLPQSNQTSLTDSKRVKGAAVAGGVGLTTLVTTLQQGSDVVQQAATQVHDAAQVVGDTADKPAIVAAAQTMSKVVAANQANHIIMALLAVLLVGVAVFIIWTKISDLKKSGRG